MYSVKKHPQLESTLFDEEIDVVVSVLKDVLDGFSGSGAFVLTSQRGNSTNEEKILSFAIGDKSTAEEEMAALKKAIKKTLGKDNSRSYIEWVDNQPILVLNAAYGRFICGFFCSDPDYSVGVLAATAKTLTRLFNEEGQLRGSCKEIPWHEFADELPIITKRVVELFDIHKTPAIKRWEKWHKQNPMSDPLFT